MVRSRGFARQSYAEEGENDESEQQSSASNPSSDAEDDNDDADYGRKVSKKSPKKGKVKKTPRGKISPSKVPFSKKYSKKSAAKSSSKKSKKPAAKKAKNSAVSPQRHGGRSAKKIKYYQASSDEEAQSEYEEEEPEESESPSSEEETSDDEHTYKPGRGRGSAKKSKYKEEKSPKKGSNANLPKVSEMVIDCIKALKDNPKKGSTIGAIKETIGLNWQVNMKVYDGKVKRYILKAVESGDLIQTKGKGLRGRFTVPGMKVKRRKRKLKETKLDLDEVEYEPKKTKRDEDRAKDEEDLEQKRYERALWKERMDAEKALEKARRPKKPKVEKDYEVETVKGMRERDGNRQYLVKFKGYSKAQWEPEENVQGCQDLIDEYFNVERRRIKEEEERRKKMEVDGCYEVSRITDVRFKKDNSREFLIRWKGCRPEDDTWEPEENLDQADMIERFMSKWEQVVQVPERSLREAPKVVERLAFASSHRVGKRNQGFRVTYAGMDE